MEVLVIVLLALSVLTNVLIVVWFMSKQKKGEQAEVATDRGRPSEVEPKKEEPPTFQFTAENLTYGKLQTNSPSKPGPLLDKVVLISDDTPDNIEILIDMLDQIGLSDFYLARNGREAVSVATTTELDLIYMDIQMPIMNGLDASEKISELPEHRHTPIIPITAHSRIVTEERCQESGLFGFLQKPVIMDKLYQITEEALCGDEAEPVPFRQAV
jgi:CheY-like chemotaxis protein